METSWLHPREELVTTMGRIYRYGMTTTSGGNLSILDPDGSIWITPSRLDKGKLGKADIVRVGADGSCGTGAAPSSELPFHREIYRRRPDIKAIVHAHPGALVAFSICRLLPDLRVQGHAYEVCRRIAYAPYACPGSEELGVNIADAFASGADCVMLENHGVVVGGSDLQDAFQRFETLEFVARTLAAAHRIGKVEVLDESALSGRPRPTLGTLESRPPTNREKELRGELCDFVLRSYQHRLLISTAGAFSTRLEGNEFLITPHRRDRLELDASKIVRATATACEAGGRPSRASLLHARIYEKHPEVGAVILAQPHFASAYGISDAELCTRTIPESYLVLRDAPKVDFGCLVEDADRLAGEIDPVRRPVVMIRNEGALVTGKNLLDAYDRLEVLEATAEALQLSHALGPLVPMPDAALSELHRAFGVVE